MASSYEECRAECTGIFLCLQPAVLSVFGHGGPVDPTTSVHDICYVNWLYAEMIACLALGLQ